MIGLFLTIGIFPFFAVLAIIKTGVSVQENALFFIDNLKFISDDFTFVT
jgi:hypothetical protein